MFFFLWEKLYYRMKRFWNLPISRPNSEWGPADPKLKGEWLQRNVEQVTKLWPTWRPNREALFTVFIAEFYRKVLKFFSYFTKFSVLYRQACHVGMLSLVSFCLTWTNRSSWWSSMSWRCAVIGRLWYVAHWPDNSFSFLYIKVL